MRVLEKRLSQIIYLRSEIGAAKQITDLAFNVNIPPGRSLTDWTIRMKHTTRNSYTGLNQVETSGWAIIYQSNQTLSSGWNWFHFDTPFDYNGTQNLMIDFSFKNPSTASAGNYFRHGASQTRNYVMIDVDGDAGSPLNWGYYSNWDSYMQNNSMPVLKLLSTAPSDPLVGDFDASCDVTMPDLAIFSQAWMAQQADGDYNSDCDLTASKGQVNIQDLMLLIDQWLETYNY